MKVAVRYFSRSGNTKKLAEAIAKAAGVEAKDCGVPLSDPVDVLFLGASVYGGAPDKQLSDFIAALDPQSVKCAALFGSSAIAKKPDQGTEKLLAQKNIPVSERRFFCRGSFLFLHRGRPNAEDLKQAADFAAGFEKK
jgi:flavodoxin